MSGQDREEKRLVNMFKVQGLLSSQSFTIESGPFHSWDGLMGFWLYLGICFLWWITTLKWGLLWENHTLLVPEKETFQDFFRSSCASEPLVKFTGAWNLGPSQPASVDPESLDWHLQVIIVFMYYCTIIIVLLLLILYYIFITVLYYCKNQPTNPFFKDKIIEAIIK